MSWSVGRRPGDEKLTFESLGRSAARNVKEQVKSSRSKWVREVLAM